MKKQIVILGLVVLQLILAGTLFKILYWPGANILLTIGCVLFSLIFLPLAVYNSYKEQERYLWLHLVSLFVFSFGVLSILFKVMHWAGSQILMELALPLPFIVFLPVYLYQTRLDNKVRDINFLGVLLGLTFIAVFGVLLSLS